MGPAGPTGATGPKGDKGDQGLTGLSAYQVAVLNGFVGTETQWLASLEGPQGPTGPQGPQGEAGAPYGNIDGGKANSVYGGISPLVGGNASSF